MYLARELRLRMEYLRKPEGQKRGKGLKTKPGILNKKVYPSCGSPISMVIDDQHAINRHLEKLAALYKHGRPDKEVTK